MSLSQYIIICRGKINFQTAETVPAKVRAISDAATSLVSHIDITHPGRLTTALTQPVSDLQHYLMNNAATISPEEAELKAVEMFNYLDALEDTFDNKGVTR